MKSRGENHFLLCYPSLAIDVPCTSKRWATIIFKVVKSEVTLINTHTHICIYIIIHTYSIYIYLQTYINIHMREKNSYNCSVSRLARGTPPAYPYLMLRHTVYILYPYTNEFPVFFSTVIFFIQFYSHVYWSNSPLLLNYTYTVVWFYLPMILDQGSLSCSTLFLQQPPLRQRPSLRQRIRWSS